MIQCIYSSCNLIWSDLVEIAGALSWKNFLEIIRCPFLVSCKLTKKRFSFVSNFKKLTFA